MKSERILVYWLTIMIIIKKRLLKHTHIQNGSSGATHKTKK